MKWEKDMNYRLKDIRLFIILFICAFIFVLILAPSMGMSITQVLWPYGILLLVVLLILIIGLNYAIRKIR